MPKLTPEEKAYRKKQRMIKKIAQVTAHKQLDDRLTYLLEHETKRPPQPWL